VYRPAADTTPTVATTSRAKYFIDWQPIVGSVVMISTMQLKGIVIYGRVDRGRYWPAADNSTGYETNMVCYGIHSASIEMYRRAADTTLLTLLVQIPAPSKLGIRGSLCRLCWLPANKRLSAAKCYRRCVSAGCQYQRPRPPVLTTWYQQAADTIDVAAITEENET
jgi:hypothetical protein